MTNAIPGRCRYFLTYSGVTLPLKLMTELEPAQLENRNTYFRGYFDGEDRLIGLQKLVYGEVEMEHRYAYHANGALRSVEIIDADGERNSMRFDEYGERLAGQ
jgi:YD repeat-containing protein